MIEVFDWGNHGFEIYDKELASQKFGGGVFIAAIKEKWFNNETRWTAIYIDEVHTFSVLGYRRLKNIIGASTKFGDVYIHLLETEEIERSSLVKSLVELYKPPLNIFEIYQTDRPQNEKTGSDIVICRCSLKKSQGLELNFQYEKQYLQLINEYKEEIKFVYETQENLRKERTQFFTNSLKDIIQTMKSSDIDKSLSEKWIKELVASYTKSIDFSGDLVKTHVIEILSLLASEIKRQVSDIKLEFASD